MILQLVTHTLYTIVSSIILNIIVTDFRTNVRFRILVRHGRLSEKLIVISVVGQMSVSDKCPRIIIIPPLVLHVVQSPGFMRAISGIQRLSNARYLCSRAQPLCQAASAHATIGYIVCNHVVQRRTARVARF